MELFFEPTRGRPFTIEVGYFDTMLEIKEKVHRYHDIPVSKQTLLFNGQILSDDLNIHSSHILDRSRIQIALLEQPQQQQHKIATRKVTTTTADLLKLPNSKFNAIDATDSLQRLKERIHEMDGVPASRLMLRSQWNDLQDSRVIGDYNIPERSEIETSAATSSSTGSGHAYVNANNNMNNHNNSSNCNNNYSSNNNIGCKKTMTSAPSAVATLVVKVVVQTINGETRKVPVEVNVSDSVGVLRRELERTRQLGLVLPTAEGYFFIYKQNVMDEDRSFRWHGVANGDTIEIFNGSVSGGT